MMWSSVLSPRFLYSCPCCQMTARCHVLTSHDIKCPDKMNLQNLYKSRHHTLLTWWPGLWPMALWQSTWGKWWLTHWASLLRWIWSISEYNLTTRVSRKWSSKIQSGIVHHKSDRKSCVLPTADRNRPWPLNHPRYCQGQAIHQINLWVCMSNSLAVKAPTD